ncbi:MAG: hypothetical protein ACO1OQ_09480 [Rufibacter sp.]
MKKLLLQLLLLLLLASCTQKSDIPAVEVLKSSSRTDFVPTLEQKIDRSKNQIYCSTLLYAWNEIRKETGGEIQIGKEFKLLRSLNQSQLFQNTLAEEEINNSISFEDYTIKASSEFSKALPFEIPFEENNHSLTFAGKRVESFGFNGVGPEKRTQVEILYYKNDQEFAIKLFPKESQHEIFLYTSPKVKGQSLQGLVSAFQKVSRRESAAQKKDESMWRYYFADEDVLSIPVLSFNLKKEYTSLVGNTVLMRDTAYTIEKASQRIALVLNHKGAKVESEAVFEAAATEAAEELPKPKRIIFDKPFLLVFQRKDAANPYLVAWIANTELMVKK